MQRFTFIIILLIISINLSAQTNIQIILKTNTPIDTIDISDLSQLEFYSFSFQNVNAHFNKSTIDCYTISYHENGKIYWRQLWLDTGNIIIHAHIDTTALIVDTVINSPAYYEAINVSAIYKNFFRQKDTIDLNNFLEKEINKNISNPFSLAVAYNYIQLNQNVKSNLYALKTLLSKQGDKFKWFSYYSLVYKRLNFLLGNSNFHFDDFSFINTNNKSTHINLTGAKYYVFDFWFLKCPPCIKDHKEIKSALQKFQQKNIKVISISTDEDFISWETYLTKNDYRWENFLEGGDKKLHNVLGLNVFPTYIVLNNNAEILKAYNSITDVENYFRMNELF
jgi:thiol-disulfide isomerase/thioredoxin